MEQKAIKTAIIGVGRWGKNVARELGSASELVYFASKESDTAVAGAKRASVEEICADSSIEAVAIATPITTHAEIVRKVLEAGKHVLCEKPLAETSVQARELVERAEKDNLVLATGYVFVYHPAYHELKLRVQGKAIKRVECVWRKYGTFTESIEMNLLTHHLSLAYDMLGLPKAAALVYREGSEAAGDRIEARLSYPSCEFTSEIDRLSQEKTHTVKVTLEDGEIFIWDGPRLYRGEEILLDSADTPLRREIEAFFDAIRGGPIPATGGDFGVHVLEIHEMLK
ncbi:MAG: Gfo/Idh/MocA family oxidoreductase [bacterium]|nr:Gfo/Idh/MocA family oxidoreductase [bacterium]